MANAWNKTRSALGMKGTAEAHIISPEDYVKDEKTGKTKFSWDAANKRNPDRQVWNGQTAGTTPGK